MNFSNHYFTEIQINENPIGDIANAGVGKVAGAVGQKLGQGALNVLRGATGRMKTIIFEPGWLKVLKPTSQANYKKAIGIYSNWKNQKTKLGPKQNFTVVDIKNGTLGNITQDDFEGLLAKYDAKVNATDINMNAEIKPRITVYVLNTAGKIIFFDLPIGKDGKKRYYAIGLDNKAERAFTLIHGMRFEDFSMEASEEATEKDIKPKIANSNDTKYKYNIPVSKYNEIIPKPGAKLQVSSTQFSLLKIFEDEVLKEAEIEPIKIIKKDEKWWNLNQDQEMNINWAKQNKDKSDVKFVGWEGDKNNGKENISLTQEFNKLIGKTSENEQTTGTTETGTLFNLLKDGDYLDQAKMPTKVKQTQKTKSGWRYLLKNGGLIFVYETTDGRHLIAFNEDAKSIVDELDLINKFSLEKTDQQPETEEAPE